MVRPEGPTSTAATDRHEQPCSCVCARADEDLRQLARAGFLAGNTRDTISTYVWLSQARIGAVNIGGSGSTELSDRIRHGHVAVDFARPVNVQGSYLATDLERGAFTLLPRGPSTVLVGVLTVGLTLPPGRCPICSAWSVSCSPSASPFCAIEEPDIEDVVRRYLPVDALIRAREASGCCPGCWA